MTTLETAMINADWYATQLHKQGCRITAYMTRQNINMTEEDGKHSSRFIEMYGDKKRLINSLAVENNGI